MEKQVRIKSIKGFGQGIAPARRKPSRPINGANPPLKNPRPEGGILKNSQKNLTCDERTLILMAILLILNN